MPTIVPPRDRIRFQSLGPVAIADADSAPLTLRTRKQVGLLFYLVRRGRPVGRDELIDLLWCDKSERLARHSLSQCCSLINKALGAEIIVTAGRDRLVAVDGTVSLDVSDFERLVSAGEHDQALALWRGSLFEGLWIPRAPQFERWLSDERERLQRAFQRLVHARMETLRNAGDHPAMRDEAERLLLLDPLDEKAMLSSLEALTLSGDRSLALRKYADFETRLRKELDSEPGTALRGWAKRVRRSEGPPPPRGRVVAPRISEITVLPAAQPFFGRTEEFAMLWKAWENTGTGKGAFIIIEGEPGIGKTALATKLVNQAHIAGGSVCFVRCYRTEKSVPFAPITALIRQLSRLPGFVALDPVWIGELSRLVPELRERYPGVPLPMAVDDAARNRLSDATVNAALSVSDEQPLMIVVDDLFDADEVSLALLHYLGRQTPRLPVLILGVVRSRNPTDYEKLFIDTARSAGFAHCVELHNLSADSIQRLTLQVLARRGIEASERAVLEVVSRSGGNPLQAIEAALSLEVGEDFKSAKHAAAQSGTFSQSARERMAQLPAHIRLVASAIAIAGRPLSELELAGVTRLAPAELATSIDVLESTHFGRRLGSGVSLLHDSYFPIVVSSTGAEQKKALHLRFAETIQSISSLRSGMQFEAARHLAMAGKHRRAFDHAMLAAEHAKSIGATRSKVEALELAWQLNPQINSTTAVELAESYLSLGDLHNMERVSAGIRRRADIDASSLLAITYVELSARLRAGRATLAETEAALESLLASSVAPFPFKNDAQVLLLQIVDKTGHFATARRTARQLRRDSGHGVLSGHALFATGYVFAKYYWPKSSLPFLELAADRLQALGSIALEQFARDCIGIVLKMLGRFEESIVHFERSLALARKNLDPHGEARCLQNRAVSEMVLGRFGRARESLFEASRLGVSAGPYSPYNSYNLAIMALSEDDNEAAIASFDECLVRATAAGNNLVAGDACAGIALACARLGRTADLAHFVGKMKDLDATCLTDRLGWLPSVALSWDMAFNSHLPDEAIARLELHSRQMRRRDVAVWLTLELEVIRLKDACYGKEVALGDRRLLVERAERYGARHVASSAAHELA